MNEKKARATKSDRWAIMQRECAECCGKIISIQEAEFNAVYRQSDGVASDLMPAVAEIAGQWVAAKLILADGANPRYFHGLQNGDFGKLARAAYQAHIFGRKIRTCGSIRQIDKQLSNKKTLRARLELFIKLSALKLYQVRLSNMSCALSDLLSPEMGERAVEVCVTSKREMIANIPKKAHIDATAPTEISAADEPLSLAEALYRDQCAYLQREEARGREAAEKRLAIERLTVAAQVERARGTHGDQMAMLVKFGEGDWMDSDEDGIDGQWLLAAKMTGACDNMSQANVDEAIKNMRHWLKVLTERQSPCEHHEIHLAISKERLHRLERRKWLLDKRANRPN